MDPIFYFALTFTVFLVFALIFAPVLLRPSPAARRMLEMVRSNRPDERRVGRNERVQEAVLSMARRLRIRLGITEDEKVKQQLLSAGIRSSGGMSAYAASRFAGPVLGLACGSLIRTNTVFWALTLAAVFYLVPDMWLMISSCPTRSIAWSKPRPASTQITNRSSASGMLFLILSRRFLIFVFSHMSGTR
jgi:hypothetical protein